MELNFDDEMLQEINNNIDLLELVSKYIELEKRGSDYFGCCPLHVDKTPSFSVTPSKNAYYCFSCGRSGGAIGFLMDFVGLSFEDAVRQAAKMVNIDLSKLCQSKTISFLKKMKSLKSKKITFKHTVLPHSEIEKFNKEEIAEWINEGINRDVLELFEVRIDNWSNRIVYPVYDIDGNLINIKGRTRYPNYKKMKIPKYINYFKIGVMDYFQGLNITLPYIKEKGQVIIFESIKSVMKLYSWGIKNSISAEKHTLTNEQIMLLIRLRVDVVFAYDSDINYYQNDVKQNINKLKLVTNVYVIEDKNLLLGGAESKNSPADLGQEIWEKLYQSKKKIV